MQDTKKDAVIKCPRCRISMVKKTRYDITIDKCKRCDGMWLDGGEIEKLLLHLKKTK